MRKLRYKIQITVILLLVLLVFVLKFNVEAYCPFGAIESMYTYFTEGRLLCALGTGNFFALSMVLLLTLLFKRVFCGYICPIGAISAFLRSLGSDLGLKQVVLSRRVGKLLASIKYFVLAGVIVLSAMTMTLVLRDISPCYVLVSVNNDVKITAFIVTGIFAVLSLFIYMPFCRWFCPFAVVQNIFSYFSPFRIKRDVNTCINCNQCSKACPMALDVANVDQVRSSACISCFECQSVCPVSKQGGPEVITWSFLGRYKVQRPGIVIFTCLLLAISFALTAEKLIDIPTYIYQRTAHSSSQVQRSTLTVRGVSCAGSAQLFVYFLERDDIYQVPGYLRIAARPREGWLDITIDHDTDIGTEALADAITEPLFDKTDHRWRASPFEIKGRTLPY